MSLKDKIGEALKEAMKSKNQAALTALRELKSFILLEETKEGASGSLSEADEMGIINKALKQRKESYEMFVNAQKPTQAEEQMAVIKVLETFLPAQLSEEELGQKIQAIITHLGANSLKDMGKVMGVASKELAGQTDNKMLSETIKRLLGQ